MKAGEALFKIRQIMDCYHEAGLVDSTCFLSEVNEVIDDFYRDLPEKIWFALCNKCDWYTFEGGTYRQVFLRTYGQEYADLDSEHESIIGDFLPEGYAFCMEATLECPANKTEAEIITDLTSLGLHYREELNQ